MYRLNLLDRITSWSAIRSWWRLESIQMTKLRRKWRSRPSLLTWSSQTSRSSRLSVSAGSGASSSYDHTTTLSRLLAVPFVLYCALCWFTAALVLLLLTWIINCSRQWRSRSAGTRLGRSLWNNWKSITLLRLNNKNTLSMKSAFLPNVIPISSFGPFQLSIFVFYLLEIVFCFLSLARTFRSLLFRLTSLPPENFSNFTSHFQILEKEEFKIFC